VGLQLALRLGYLVAQAEGGDRRGRSTPASDAGSVVQALECCDEALQILHVHVGLVAAGNR